MFEENEELVTEEVAENVETETTEETQEAVEMPTEKTFTQTEVDEMISKRLARAERKWKKESSDELRKYREAENVLNQGLETNGIEEATNKLKDFYREKGIHISEYRESNDLDLDILADYDAREIIDLGYEDVVAEVDRLAQIGYDNMNPREKKTFQKLAEYRKAEEDSRELSSLGITKDEDFENFANMLNPNLSIKEKYEMYEKYKPKKEINNIGSLKTTQANQIKDYYSPEEIEKLSDEDLDNPQIWEAVRRSMTSGK